MSRGQKLVDLALEKMKEIENNENSSQLGDVRSFLNNATTDCEYTGPQHDTYTNFEVSAVIFDSEQLPKNYTFADNVEIEFIEENSEVPSTETTVFDQVTNQSHQTVCLQQDECHEIIEDVDQCKISDDERPEVLQKNAAPISLVPYSDSCSSDRDSDLPQKSKKRRKRSQVNKSDWFAEKNRKRREMGQSYSGRTNEDGKWHYDKPKEPRKIKPRCHCKSKNGGAMTCGSISEDDRKNIFQRFWENLDWGEKKMYINDVVLCVPTRRPRDRKDVDNSRRAQSLLYHLRIGDEKKRVCKTMFLNTLCLGRWTVLSWKTSLKNDRRPSQLRHKRDDQIRPFEERKKNLVAFVDALPTMESHYCRASSSKKYLLPEWSSKNDIYKFYVKDWCQSCEPLSITVFNDVLSSKNIALFRPKKDECEKCAAYKVGSVAEEDYQLHLARKLEARKEKEKDKENEKCVLTVDLQAVLMAPKSNVSTLYYKTKLQVHNLCFYNLINKEGFCFLWNETEGGINAEEFASIWTYFITEKLSLDATEEDRRIIVYSDGCVYQNRNVTMANALLNVSILHNITIVQKYLEVGHTQMEADCMHSSIERCLRKKTINVPAEYINICKTARKDGKPYDVMYLENNFFKNFEEIMAYSSIRPGKKRGDPKVTDLRALKYTPVGDIYYKLRFGDKWNLIPQRKNNVIPKPASALKPLHQGRLPITARKYKHLQDIKLILPADYRGYYDSLPHV